MDSECSSGCDSGWTLYFEQSMLSNPLQDIASNKHADGKRAKYDNDYEEEEEEEEDLSMMSDASSGPPHYHEVEDCFEKAGNGNNGCYYQASIDTTLVKNCGKGKKTRSKDEKNETKVREIDDTASSPAYNLSNYNYIPHKNNQASMESTLNFSHGFSATHYQDGSAYWNHHYGILHSTLSGNQLQQNQWYGGNR